MGDAKTAPSMPAVSAQSPTLLGSPKATLGRIVHYRNLGDADGKYPPTNQAALVTGENEDGTVALHVYYRTGGFDLASVREGGPEERGTWHWPPRV